MKKKLSILLGVVLTVTLLLLISTSAAYGYDYKVSKSLDMRYRCVSSCWCGPSSGTSIGEYYNDVKHYYGLPGYGNTWGEMYDSLYAYMDTSPLGPTSADNYGPGFVEMALHYGYDKFSYENDGYVTDDDYWDIRDAIDNGWPVALVSWYIDGFEGVEAISTDEEDDENHWPCDDPHWIAIRGYEYWASTFGYDWNHRIVCTDSWSKASELVLDWNELVDELGSSLEFVIIKDDDPENDGYVEDFDWGSDGLSLESWQDYGGEVEWYVSTSSYGTSVAEIDTQYSKAGGKSARIYYDGSYSVTAKYKLYEPSYIDFYLKRDSTATVEFRNGNGNKRIAVRITSSGQVQYYYPYSWRTVGYVTDPNEWYRIQFKNINWVAGTYDIHVTDSNNHGSYKLGALLYGSSAYKGYLYFKSYTGSGSVWIDEIKDSLR